MNIVLDSRNKGKCSIRVRMKDVRRKHNSVGSDNFCLLSSLKEFTQGEITGVFRHSVDCSLHYFVVFLLLLPLSYIQMFRVLSAVHYNEEEQQWRHSETIANNEKCVCHSNWIDNHSHRFTIRRSFVEVLFRAIDDGLLKWMKQIH